MPFFLYFCTQKQRLWTLKSHQNINRRVISRKPSDNSPKASSRESPHRCCLA